MNDEQHGSPVAVVTVTNERVQDKLRRNGLIVALAALVALIGVVLLAALVIVPAIRTIDRQNLLIAQQSRTIDKLSSDNECRARAAADQTNAFSDFVEIGFDNLTARAVGQTVDPKKLADALHTLNLANIAKQRSVTGCGP